MLLLLVLRYNDYDFCTSLIVLVYVRRFYCFPILTARNVSWSKLGLQTIVEGTRRTKRHFALVNLLPAQIFMRADNNFSILWQADDVKTHALSDPLSAR